MRVTVVVLAAALGGCGSAPPPAPKPQPLPENVAPEQANEDSGYPDSADSIARPSIERYMRWKFPDQVASGSLKMSFGFAGGDAELVGELKAFGLTTIGDLDAIVPDDFIDKAVAEWRAGTNIMGLLRAYGIDLAPAFAAGVTPATGSRPSQRPSTPGR